MELRLRCPFKYQRDGSYQLPEELLGSGSVVSLRVARKIGNAGFQFWLLHLLQLTLFLQACFLVCKMRMRTLTLKHFM